MRVFVAGASGAIGQPLIVSLVRQGHVVTGMTRSEAGARRLRDLGASVVQISAFDRPAVDQAIRRSQAEVVIDQLTALPQHPSEMAAAAAGDRKLRQAAFSCGPAAGWRETSAVGGVLGRGGVSDCRTVRA